MNNNETYNTKKIIKRVTKDLLGNNKIIILILSILIIVTIFGTIAPKVTGEVMTEISNQLIVKVGSNGTMSFNRINLLLIILIIIYIMQYILSCVNCNLMIELCQNYIFTLRNKMSKKITNLPKEYFDKKSNGEILSLLINDIENISINIYGILRETFSEILNLIGASIMLFTISPVLTIVNGGTIIISAIIITILANTSRKYFAEKQEKVADLNSSVEEKYSAHSVIKIFNLQESMQQKLDDKNTKLKDISIKSNFIASISKGIVTFIENVSIAMTAVVSAVLITNGYLEIGYIYTAISYTKNMVNPLGKIAGTNNDIMNIIVSAKRIYQFLDEQEIKEVGKKIEFKENINANSVWFAYDKENYVLKNIDVDIKKGQKIAFIGKTGCGKTTLISLIMNLYQLNKGNIKMDGIDINCIKPKEYIKNFAVISQDINLFNDTILENIKYGNNQIEDNEIIQIAKNIGIHDMFSNLENGYNTIINENNTNLSNGLKQLIVLMQAIISKAPILIFDEATNKLDEETEKKINDIINYMRNSKTLIIIAHKLDIIKDADVIYAIKDGNIVKKGTYDELINNKII